MKSCLFMFQYQTTKLSALVPALGARPIFMRFHYCCRLKLIEKASSMKRFSREVRQEMGGRYGTCSAVVAARAGKQSVVTEEAIQQVEEKMLKVLPGQAHPLGASAN